MEEMAAFSAYGAYLLGASSVAWVPPSAIGVAKTCPEIVPPPDVKTAEGVHAKPCFLVSSAGDGGSSIPYATSSAPILQKI